MSSFTRRQSKYVKKPYRVRNWAEYEAGLRSRGSLTVWIDVDGEAGTVPGWNAPKRARRKPGRQKRYSNLAIETALRIGRVFHLPSRQAEGFLRSLFSLLNLNADVPDHTTVSRRGKKLGKVDIRNQQSNRPIHLIIDSSGLKVHVGQMRKPPKNRDYRKIHLGVDEQTGEVVACNLTSKSASDASRVPSLLGQVARTVASARADSAYDAKAVYQAVEDHREHRSPRVLIPPKKNARIDLKSPALGERNRNIRSRTRLGKRSWHTKSGYSKRSKGETAFSRYKTILGPAMRARGLAAQRVEARIGCQILNTMTALGMPDGYMVG
jgi:hypothetical protein